jgi:hypothetical protein
MLPAKIIAIFCKCASKFTIHAKIKHNAKILTKKAKLFLNKKCSARIMSKISFLLVQKIFLQSITRAHMKTPTKAAPVEKEEEEIVEIPVTVGTPPSSVADPGSGAFLTP